MKRVRKMLGGFAGMVLATVVAVALLGFVLACLRQISSARAQNYEYVVTPLLALSNTAQSVKASPGTMLYYSCVNPNAAIAWLQIYDSIGAIVVGTTAATLAFQLPATSATGQMPPRVTGGYFATAGLQAAVTTTQTGGAAPSTAIPCDIAHR